MTTTNPPYEKLVENAPVGVFQVTVDEEQLGDVEPDQQHLYVNETLTDILAFDSRGHFHSEVSSIEYENPSDREALQDKIEATGNVEAFETALVTNNGGTVDVLISGTLEDDEFTGYVTDITERKQLERKAAQQAEAILEQSTPIVQIWEGITLATVVGTLDTQRAQRLTEQLLTELTENQSEVALVDITGVPNVDTATAQHLIDTVNAVSLLGSEVIITGINPNIAQTLVQLGITLDNIRTKSSLSDGLELGIQLINDDNFAGTESA
jgi:anti-anti-sigma regulatory factor